MIIVGVIHHVFISQKLKKLKEVGILPFCPFFAANCLYYYCALSFGIDKQNSRQLGSFRARAQFTVNAVCCICVVAWCRNEFLLLCDLYGRWGHGYCSFVCEIFLNPVLAALDIQVDVDDLDNLATPEMIMLSAVSGEGAQDR